MTDRDWAKYRRRALLRPPEPEPVTGCFRHFVVIPVFDELQELPATLESLAVALRQNDDGPVGVLLVVNHAADAPAPRQAADRETLRRLRAGDRTLTGGLTPGETLCWIDAASPGRELTRGVGEARRIGLDSALFQLAPEARETALLYSLDADSPVAPDYFAAVSGWFGSHPEAGAAAPEVRHRPGATPELEAAIRSYERYMRDYVERLRAAGSPYAFHTIGSAMVARATAYAACGGMRVRHGGEDFYFMQALRKVAPLGEIAGPLVFPAARPSDRVPFGTGPAIRSQLAGRPLPVYCDAGFAVLTEVLGAAGGGRLRRPDAFRAALPEAGRRFLEQEGFFTVWPSVLANLPKKDGAEKTAFHHWFDALKTLKLLHFCNREAGVE